MPYKIPDVVETEFRLEELDSRENIPDEEATMIMVKTASVAENSKRSQLFSKYVQEIPKDDAEPERIIYNFPLYTLMQKETFLTLVGCNIQFPTGKSDNEGNPELKPLFRFRKTPRGNELNMSELEFNKAWGMLDDDVAAEIHSKVLEVNPHWIFQNVGGNTDLGEG